MFKRSSALIMGLALSYALAVPASAQTQLQQTDMQNPQPMVQPAPAREDNVRTEMESPQDDDRTEMEIKTTEPTISPSVAVDPSEVINARPFSLEANYMSIPGAFRFLTYDRTGTWLTHDESVAQVRDDTESASR
jgi:hypothetical protein